MTVVSQIIWCHGSETAITEQQEKPRSLYDWYIYSVKQLEELTDLVRTDLNNIQRRIIVALITTDVHSRDVLEELLKNGVESP